MRQVDHYPYKRKSPSECYGKPIGAQCQLVVVDPTTKGGREAASKRLGLTFQKPGSRRFSSLRLSAKLGDADAADRLRLRARKWSADGWKLETIARHLGTSIADVLDMLAHSQEKEMLPRLQKKNKS